MPLDCNDVQKFELTVIFLKMSTMDKEQDI